MITITHLNKTSDACPVQWFGILSNGKSLCVRYRSGRLMVFVGPQGVSVQDAVRSGEMKRISDVAVNDPDCDDIEWDEIADTVEAVINKKRSNPPMTDEKSYNEGSRIAYLHMLREIIQHLEGEQKEIARYVMERQETLAKIEELYDLLDPDTEFDDALYIPDLLETVISAVDHLKTMWLRRE